MDTEQGSKVFGVYLTNFSYSTILTPRGGWNFVYREDWEAFNDGDCGLWSVKLRHLKMRKKLLLPEEYLT